MLIDALTFFCLLCLGIEQPDYTVGIAHRRHFWIGDNDGYVGEAHGERCAAFNSCRAIADDPIEFPAQLLDYARHAFLGQSILVPGLRRWQQPQRLESFVADERLR